MGTTRQYASDRDVQAAGDVLTLARGLLAEAEAAVLSARTVVDAVATGKAAWHLNGAQDEYDSHLRWVRSMAGDINAAIKRLP